MKTGAHTPHPNELVISTWRSADREWQTKEKRCVVIHTL